MSHSGMSGKEIHAASSPEHPKETKLCALASRGSPTCTLHALALSAAAAPPLHHLLRCAPGSSQVRLLHRTGCVAREVATDMAD
mmetsp:Transcript_16539/g.41284  ORF Transcript_16539/g.41284 Transcript_16539/m.41284 type:complete len:84 (-) Transcript_16539:426-677(-)